MSDDVLSAATGAGSFVTVGDKEYQISPLSMRQLIAAQNDALEEFQDSYLGTFHRNAKLLGSNSEKIILDEMKKVAKWTAEDLPEKKAYDVSDLEVTEELKALLQDVYEEIPATKEYILALVTYGLDGGELNPVMIAKACGVENIPTKSIPYVMWYITGHFRGMTVFVWSSLQKHHKEITRQDVESWSLSELMEGVAKAQKHTTPSAKNS